jgi:SAM-dependent methyltransferase
MSVNPPTSLVIDETGNLIGKNFAVQDQFYPEPDFETARFVNAMLTRYGGARSILDVGCGFGREAGYLASLGYYVVGIEPNPTMLERARSNHPEIEFLDAAMPGFDLERTFDAVICMGSSFLYNYTNEAVYESLMTFARHVEPGGLLLMEMRNGAFFLTKAGWAEWLDVDHEKTITVDGQEIRSVGRYWIDLESQQLRRTRTWTVPGRDEPVVQQSAFRLLFPQELRFYLSQAGFEVVTMFDSPGPRAAEPWTSDDLELSSTIEKPRLHLVARRVAS